MAVEKDFEQLDDYLTNRLSEGERSAFEAKMEGDPELKQEYQFQQELIEGLRNNRIAELKQMLNNTPIPAFQAGESGLMTNVIATAAVVGLVATGAYFLFTAEEPGSISNVQNEQPTEITTPVEDQDTIGSGSDNDNSGVTTPIDTKKETVTSSPKSRTVEDAARARERELIKIVNSTFITSNTEVITQSNFGAYNFHYAFEKKKLVLYGSFEPNQYQILEFITKDEHIFFLSYKSKYYLLDEHAQAPAPLLPIKDAQLQKKLREFRTK